ncbi:hypothetical protein [Agromyces bauzanensis]
MSGPTHLGNRIGNAATIHLYSRHTRAHALDVAQSLANPGEAVVLTPPDEEGTAWHATYERALWAATIDPSVVVVAVLGDARVDLAGSVVHFEHPASASTPTPVAVSVYVQTDGATVVQIDTHGDDRLRVNVNDSTVFDEGVETGARYVGADE